MANPFSGLENIGQSYLQGVQLANQRQYREEAAAQRAEDTRVRQQYYQDLVDQRREAAALAATGRDEGLAIKFGRFLKRKSDGSIDIVGSATAQEEAGNRNQFLETFGFAETQGIPIPGVELTPEEKKSQFYNRGRAQGIVAKTKENQQFDRILAAKGVFPIDGQREIPADLESSISGPSQDTELNVLNEISQPEVAPQTFVQPPQRTALQMGAGQRVTINGRQYNVPVAAKKAEKAGTMKFTDPNGVEYSLPVSPEAARDLLSKRLASPEGEQDPYADIDEALKNLRKLAKNKDDEVNVYEDAEGNVKVRKDQFGFTGESKGLTFGEAKAQLEVKRKDRQQMMRESETPPGPEAGIKQGTNRVPLISPNQVIDVRSIKGLRPIGRGTNAPTATTNAPPQVRLPVDSLAPASSMSSESLSELDLDELRQAMLEAQSNGMDPAVLGLQIRQALNEAGVGTNSLPLGLSQEKLDAILRMPRGRAPVEL